MKDHDRIKNTLQQLEIPEDLQARIKQNWLLQKSKPGKRTRGLSRLVWPAVAAMVLAVWATFEIPSTPDVVNAAMADIVRDAENHAGIYLPLDAVLAAYPLKKIPADKVKISKHCTLDNITATHLKFAMAHQGEMHLFLNHGSFHRHWLQAKQGRIANMGWEIRTLTRDTSVLVLFSGNLNPQTVNRMIDDILIG